MGRNLNGFILFGAFGQLGFELCRELLNKGFEINHVDICDYVEDQEIMDEKALFIGRNSNFKIYREDEWLEACTLDYPIIIPIYDWHFFQDNEIQKLKEKINQLLLLYRNKINEPHIITLDIKKGADKHPQLEEVAKNIQDATKKNLAIQLPILYGKWLTSSSYIFNVLTNNCVRKSYDAIHLIDAAKAAVELILTNEVGNFYIKNSKEDCWIRYLYELTGIKSGTENIGNEKAGFSGEPIMVNECRSWSLEDDKKRLFKLSPEFVFPG